ncbi:MAG: hypothetical protein JXN61_04100 [Sedimentisphaerales bacterium]|nr:hypothetical protein [Sedimentisphaerales bacterium]
MCAVDANDVDPVVVEMCAEVIRKNLGTLNDLPRELANTVANVYYRSFKLGGDVVARSKANPNCLPAGAAGGGSMREVLLNLMRDVSSCIVDSDSVRGFVYGLRRIDKNQQPHLYAYTVEFILDCLKYDIPDAGEKSALRRRFERHFHKGKVKEIPDLIDRMDI